MDDIRTLTQFYKALGDETRLRLVALLAGQCQGRALCVGRLAEKLSVSPSAISQKPLYQMRRVIPCVVRIRDAAARGEKSGIRKNAPNAPLSRSASATGRQESTPVSPRTVAADAKRAQERPN